MKRFSQEQIEKILKEREDGASIPSLVKKYGFGRSTFNFWQSRANGKARRKVSGKPHVDTVISQKIGKQYKIDAIKTQIGKHQRAIDQLKIRLGELVLEE